MTQVGFDVRQLSPAEPASLYGLWGRFLTYVTHLKSDVRQKGPASRTTGRGLFFLSAGFFEGFGDYPLQLPVGAAELVRSPTFQSFHCSGVNPEDEAPDSIFVRGHF